jgi:hypothetical protein
MNVQELSASVVRVSAHILDTEIIITEHILSFISPVVLFMLNPQTIFLFVAHNTQKVLDKMSTLL